MYTYVNTTQITDEIQIYVGEGGWGLNPLPILDQLHLEEGDQGVDELLKVEVKAFDPTSEC